MRALGYEAVDAADGQEALARLRTEQGITVLVTDWHMPVLDGLSLVKEVRGDDALRHLRILMITAENTQPRVAEALAAGVDELVMKPFTRDMIEDKLRLLGLGA